MISIFYLLWKGVCKRRRSVFMDTFTSVCVKSRHILLDIHNNESSITPAFLYSVRRSIFDSDGLNFTNSEIEKEFWQDLKAKARFNSCSRQIYCLFSLLQSVSSHQCVRMESGQWACECGDSLRMHISCYLIRVVLLIMWLTPLSINKTRYIYCWHQ